MSASSNPAFRPEINGLRAWAVGAVLLYHFQVPGFSGGLVGVDVFFVISGYLMTQIILFDHQPQGGFSLPNFYLARARRIVPALIAPCVVLLAGGWFLLLPREYQLLANHVVSSITFISNIEYWGESGYFDAVSHEKWLLHTWSLSVEWQFYVLYPLFLMVVRRLGSSQHLLRFAMFAVFAASLVLSMIVPAWDDVAAFYLLPTRAWELVAGGLAFLVPTRLAAWARRHRHVEHFGFLMIVVSIVHLGAERPWPGAWAAVPVLGAVLVVVARRGDSRLTSGSMAQWLGSRSYPIYLWHWPVAVLLVNLGLNGEPVPILIGLCASLLLGHASLTLIENPSRRWLQSVSFRAASSALMLAASALGAVAFIISVKEGVPGRMPTEAVRALAAVDDRNPRMAECQAARRISASRCVYGGPTLGVIVIGDSHATPFLRAVEKALPSETLHVLDWTMPGCPPVLHAKTIATARSPNCAKFVEWAVEESGRLPKGVPLLAISRASLYAFGPTEPWRASEPFPLIYFKDPVDKPTAEFLMDYRNALVETACAFARTRPVYLMRPIPEMPENVPKSVGRALMWGTQKRVSLPMTDYFERHQFVWDAQDLAAKECGVKVLDPTQYLCAGGTCQGAQDNMPLYYDDDHLSEFGAGKLVPMLRTMFKDNAPDTSSGQMQQASTR